MSIDRTRLESSCSYSTHVSHPHHPLVVRCEVYSYSRWGLELWSAILCTKYFPGRKRNLTKLCHMSCPPPCSLFESRKLPTMVAHPLKMFTVYCLLFTVVYFVVKRAKYIYIYVCKNVKMIIDSDRDRPRQDLPRLYSMGNATRNAQRACTAARGLRVALFRSSHARPWSSWSSVVVVVVGLVGYAFHCSLV